MTNTQEDTSNLLSESEKQPISAPVLEASPKNESDEVSKDQTAIKLISPIQQPDSEQKTINLVREIMQGRYISVFYAIKIGKLPANLLIDPRNKWHLVHYLVMHDKLEELEILITKFDCDINILDVYKQTPLHMAALHHKTAIFQYLIRQPMITFDNCDTIHCSPLLNAVKSEFIEAFIYLYFEKGCNIKVTDFQGLSVVHWAAYKGTVPLLKLFRHIPDVNFNVTDAEGTTPISKAISGISYAGVKYLISVLNIDLDVKSNRKVSVLEFTESSIMHPRIISYVKKHVELQKIKKQGAFGYLNNNGITKGYSHIIRHVKRTYGHYLSILINILVMILIAFSTIQFKTLRNIIGSIGVSSYIFYIILFVLLLLRKNPGYIEKRDLNHPNNAISVLLEEMRKGEWPDCSDYCFTCLRKPLKSSYHCLNCDRCVPNFQFHLRPLDLGICIGQTNFHIYFFYVFFKAACCFLYSVCMLNVMGTTKTSFPVSLVEQWLKLFGKSKLVALFILFLIYRSADVAYNLLIMLTAIWKGMTVDEMRNIDLHKYLFDIEKNAKGEVRYVHKVRTWKDNCRNVIGFLCGTLDSLKGRVLKDNEQYIELPSSSIRFDDAIEL